MMNDMLQQCLAIHVGHTRTKIGLYQLSGKSPSETQTFPAQKLFLTTQVDEPVPWEELAPSVGPERLHRIVITGSNLARAEELSKNWHADHEAPILLFDRMKFPIRSLVDAPDKVGADRLLNAIAVNAMRDADRPAIIVDSGTAVTVDVVDASGAFLGGAILPGVEMGAQALHQFTTTLPLIDGRDFRAETPEVLGRNSESAISSGLYWGHLGAVKEIVDQLRKELSAMPQLFLTGGALTLLTSAFPTATAQADLTLVGTVLAAQSAESHQHHQLAE